MLILIDDKWKVLILRDLVDGIRRFGEQKKSIGNVSQKVLTAQLRDMEYKGLMSRKVYAEVPPKVEYTLTEFGYSLEPVLDALQSWGKNIRQGIRLINCIAYQSNLITSHMLYYAKSKNKDVRDEFSNCAQL